MPKQGFIDRPAANLSWQQNSIAIDSCQPKTSKADKRLITKMLDLANQKIESGDFKDAEQHLRTALARVPNHPECKAQLAICLAAGKRRFSSAERLAKQVIEDYPSKPQGYLALGQVNLHGSRRNTAFKLFRKADQLSPLHGDMKHEIKKLDPRRQPVLSVIGRNHPLNILMGKWRAWLQCDNHWLLVVGAVGVALALIIYASLQ